MKEKAALALALLLAAGVAHAVPPLECQSCDRPDILDYDTFFTTGADTVTFVSGPNPAYIFTGFVKLFLGLDEKAPPLAYGTQFLRAFRTFGHVRNQMYWEVFEPDKLQRTATKTSLSQKDFVAVGLYRAGTSNGTYLYQDTYTAQSMQGCTASASVDDKKEVAQWKVACKVLADVLTQLGIPANEQPFIASILDTSTNNKVQIDGKVAF